MHGWTRTHDEQMNKTKFNDIADTANFFVVYPQGTIDSLIGISGTHWNVMFGTGIDDVGFISAMIDEIYWSHGINLSRVYATGFSNGGFMSYTLACELSDRIAAIAPVSGAMNFVQQAVCNPGYVAPCLHIHGTSDNTVPFTGTNIYLGIIFLTEYWGSLNSCDILPNISIVSNSSLFDLCTATINTYDNCNDSAEHLLYIVQNGGHQWPGSSNNNILSGPTCQDFDASEVIWEFFSKYQHPNPRPIVTTNINSDFKVNDLGIFVKGKTINFRSKAQSVEVYNSLGTLLYRNDNLNQQFLELDISNQIIFVRYSNTNGNSTDKVFFE
jgi:polyhydroxybutyrate depolymerase